MKTLVFLEDHEGALQKDSLGVLSKAASLDGEVEAVLLGSGIEGLAAEAGKYGAARVHVMDDPLLAKPLPQPRVDALETLIGERGFDTVLFAASVLSADVAAALAARLDAGLNWDLDRGRLAAELGFGAVSPNSIDAVSGRDPALEYLAAAAICAVHLSRLGGELVLWSSEEFGFAEPAEGFASGSSIMPQKKNPDAAELLRAKAPRVVSSFTTLAGVLHGLPLAYAKDLQEDKEALFDAVDTLELCLEAADALLAGLHFDRERLAEAASDEFLAATDLADLLVRKGLPFREAHGVVGGLVREALEGGKALSDLSPEVLRRHSELLDESYYELLRDGGWLESKGSAGGTASARVAEQLEAARTALTEVRGTGSR